MQGAHLPIGQLLPSAASVLLLANPMPSPFCSSTCSILQLAAAAIEAELGQSVGVAAGTRMRCGATPSVCVLPAARSGVPRRTKAINVLTTFPLVSM